MAALSKSANKANFNTGDTPTEANFASLIDSFQDLHWLNVKDFGAIGDKVADDTAAILAAIAAAKAMVAGGMAPVPVYLPPGDYNFSATLTLGHKIMMVGAGRWSSRLWLTAPLGAGVPAIRLDDPVTGVASFQHGNALRSLGLNCQGNAEIGVLAANVNEGGGLYDCMILDWTLTGFHATANASGYLCINYMIDDCEIYSVQGAGAGMIGIHIDRGNHSLTINHVTTQCHLVGGVSVSPNSCGILYAPGSTAGSDADANSVLITNCHFEACTDGVQMYQGRGIVLNCDGWTDVDHTVHWANRANGYSAVITNKKTGGFPIKDSSTRSSARSSNGTDPLLLFYEEPIGGVTDLYYTRPYHPLAQGMNRSVFTTTATPDGSGNISITHGLGYNPLFAFAGIDATDGKYVVIAARSFTSITLNVRQSGGANYTAGSVRVWVDLVL